MAAVNETEDTPGDVSEFTYVHFSAIQLSQNRIRFIILNNKKSVIVPGSIEQIENDGSPLFLAADVLAGTSYLSKNYNRIYTRYAKHGLATKLSPKDFQFVGIKQGACLWFFSVQGLFNVVFEYQTKDVQRECLSKLKNTWLQQYHASDLDDTMTVRVGTDADDLNGCQQDLIHTKPLITNHVPSLGEDKEVGGYSRQSSDRTRSLDDGFRAGLCINNDNMSRGLKENVETLKSFDSNVKSMTEIDNQDSEVEHNLQEIHILVSYDKHLEVNRLTKYVQTDNTYFESNRHETSTQTDDIINKRHCHNDSEWNMISDIVWDMYNKHQCKRTVLKVLQVLKIEIENLVSERCLCDIVDMYVNLTEKQGFYSEGNWNLSRHKYAFLLTVCDWLGNELHKFETSISQRVEIFKKAHINCIDNLPPSETIINLVFPPCMKVLIMNWLGHGDREQECNKTLIDHDYSPPQKRGRTSINESSWFPLVQHVLEFANNALVSGVAHVVYSRLRYTR